MKNWPSKPGFWGLLLIVLGIVLVAFGVIAVYLKTLQDFNNGIDVATIYEQKFDFWEAVVTNGLVLILIGIIPLLAQGLFWLVSKIEQRNK